MKWWQILREFLRGIKIRVGGAEIELNRKQTIYPAGQSPFDSTPHKIEPPKIGPKKGNP